MEGFVSASSQQVEQEFSTNLVFAYLAHNTIKASRTVPLRLSRRELWVSSPAFVLYDKSCCASGNAEYLATVSHPPGRCSRKTCFSIAGVWICKTKHAVAEEGLSTSVG